MAQRSHAIQVQTAGTARLRSGGAAGLIAELGISPSGPGVEAFLEALQKKADEDAAKEDKMDES